MGHRSAVVLILAALFVGVVLGCEPPGKGWSARTPVLDGDLRTYGAWGVDIDGDGDQDLLVNDHGSPSSGLYMNDGSGKLTKRSDVFAPYPGSNGRTVDRHDCAIADVDQNGRLDIFCSSGANWGTITKVYPFQTNELLLQQANGSFVNQSQAWGVSEPTHRGRSVAFVNANGDAYPDLITTADPRDDGLRSETVLYLNDHGRRFIDKGCAGLLKIGPVRDLETTDWNGDGYTDVAISPWQGGIRLYQATKAGTFTDVTGALKAGPTTTKSWAVLFADVNGDGVADMIRSDTTSVQVRLWNTATKTFVAGQTLPETDAEGLAVGLYNGDAKPDLYVMNRGSEVDPTWNPPDHVYLGNANGTFTLFETLESPGVGDFVSTWAPTASGRISWVVGNGFGPVSGPLELLTWTKSAMTTTTTTTTTTTESTTTIDLGP